MSALSCLWYVWGDKNAEYFFGIKWCDSQRRTKKGESLISKFIQLFLGYREYIVNAVLKNLLYYFSLVILDHIEFQVYHLWEAAAINSILQLKYFLFFSCSFPSCIPSLPPQAAKGSFHSHRTSQLLKVEQQIWPAGSIKMITPPSSGQIQLNRRCTSMTRKVSCFLNS